MEQSQDMNKLMHILSNLIADAVLTDCDSIFQIARSTDSYTAVKMSSMMKSLVSEEGSYTMLCRFLFFGTNSADTNHSYEYFIRKGISTDNFYTRRIQISSPSGKTAMDFLFLPSKINDLAIALLIPVQEPINTRSLEEKKARALEDGFLYSMVVDLNKNICYEAHVPEVVHEEHDNIELRYSEWQENILPSILPEFRPLFLEQTNPSRIRKTLSKTKRYWFDLLMHNVKGTCIWTRHVFLKIRGSSSDNLTFIYVVQDVDTAKKEQIRQMHSSSDFQAARKNSISDKQEPFSVNLKQIPQKDSFQGSPTALVILNHVENEIQEHYMDSLTLQKMSEKYYINSAYLGQLFIHRYGMPFHQYLTRKRMETAARLLTETDDPVRQIAKDSGIDNTNYFNRLFRKYYQCTPVQYRNRSRS